jgi:hypothetical protein
MSGNDNYNPDDIILHKAKINPELAKQQNLSEAEIAAFELVSDRLSVFLRRPEMYSNPEESVAIVQGFEYVLQSLLKFPMGRSHHKYFCHLQGCDCPKYDNQDLFGTGKRYINSNCKWHGKESRDV